MIEELVHSGTDINVLCNTVPALCVAVMMQRMEAVTMLLKLNCDINVKTSVVQQTPLHLAVSQGLWDFARILFENSAHINDINIKIYKYDINSAHINDRDRDRAMPFMVAATNGQLRFGGFSRPLRCRY